MGTGRFKKQSPQLARKHVHTHTCTHTHTHTHAKLPTLGNGWSPSLFPQSSTWLHANSFMQTGEKQNCLHQHVGLSPVYRRFTSVFASSSRHTRTSALHHLPSATLQRRALCNLQEELSHARQTPTPAKTLPDPSFRADRALTVTRHEQHTTLTLWRSIPRQRTPHLCNCTRHAEQHDQNSAGTERSWRHSLTR